MIPVWRIKRGKFTFPSQTHTRTHGHRHPLTHRHTTLYIAHTHTHRPIYPFRRDILVLELCNFFRKLQNITEHRKKRLLQFLVYFIFVQLSEHAMHYEAITQHSSNVI